jgi:hypothetical protein
MMRRLRFIVLVSLFVPGLASAQQLLGSSTGSLFGGNSGTKPGGVYIGWGACPSPGNQYCDYLPQDYLFSGIGLIPTSNKGQVFTVTADDPGFAEVASALSSGSADYAFEFCFQGNDSLINGFPAPGAWPPACYGQGGLLPSGPGKEVTITSFKLEVAPFDFVPTMIQGSLYYEVVGLYGKVPLVRVQAFGTFAGSSTSP